MHLSEVSLIFQKLKSKRVREAVWIWNIKMPVSLNIVIKENEK